MEAKTKAEKSKGLNLASMFDWSWLSKVGESFLSVIPIVAVVVVVYLTGIVPAFSLPGLVLFLVSAVFIGIGLSLFQIGCDRSMSEIGQTIGETLFKGKKMWVVVLMTFLLGFLITVAEPDLSVMAGQIGIDKATLICMIGLGVGIFLVVGVLRILFQKSLKILFLSFYGIVFALTGLVDPKLLPIAFDSGGVTTGPVTVPFILAFGAGLAASRSHGGRSSEDSFGLTALASVGPIIMVMILALFMDTSAMEYHFESVSYIEAQDFATCWNSALPVIGSDLLAQFGSVALAVCPIAAFFIVYDLLFVKLSLKQLARILIGLIYAYLGLVIFMTTVEVGFLPVAQLLGKSLGSDASLVWVAILLGGLFGVFGVFAEPAVHVLVHQIEKVSEGTIKSFNVLIIMALAVGGGVALAALRAYLGFSLLYYMVPGYILALGLTFVVPGIYTSMAFDSGGVASGPMASTFVMPFVIGFTVGAKDETLVFENAFGSIAMIALMPLIVIQMMGLYAVVKRRLIDRKIREGFIEEDDCQIIQLVA